MVRGIQQKEIDVLAYTLMMLKDRDGSFQMGLNPYSFHSETMFFLGLNVCLLKTFVIPFTFTASNHVSSGQSGLTRKKNNHRPLIRAVLKCPWIFLPFSVIAHHQLYYTYNRTGSKAAEVDSAVILDIGII